MSRTNRLWWVTVHAIPGAHLTAITEHGQAVAARLRACFAEAARARP